MILLFCRHFSVTLTVPAADLLYTNYGTVEDFQELDKRNLSCVGKIVIMRYGKIFQRNKVIQSKLSLRPLS